SSGAGRTSDGNGSHASTLKSPSYTKSVSWQHYRKFTCLSNIFYRLEFLILSRICLYLSEFGLISQVILLPNTAERAGVDNTLNKQ
ncbi:MULTISPECIES: hypothetical protein, partial [Shigella]